MDWEPNTTHEIRIQRAQMLHKIRAFFYERDVLEVETPGLSQAANTDPYIESYQIDTDSSLRYLHTSPEYPMKRLLAAGSGDIYQISKVWRKGESGIKHNPEFSLLEWYRVGFDYHQLIQEVDDLLTGLFSTSDIKFQQPALIVTYQQLFLEKLGLNPHTVEHAELAECCKLHISHLDTDDFNRQGLLDALLTHCIEPEFEQNRLTFVIDYPSSQSALATLRHNSPNTDEKDAVAERFEVYLGSLELGNGYQEETRYKRNRDILKSENTIRRQHKLNQMPEDNLFLEAIKHGMPDCSGVAIGLDRLLMGLLNEKEIQNVINFPWNKA